MKREIQLVVMRAPQVLLAFAVLLSIAFLASPGFVDSVNGDGTVTMLSGVGAVLWWVVILPNATSDYPRDAVLLVSLLLAQVAFFVLPLLVVLRRFSSLALRVFFCVLFVAGFISMTSIIGRSELVAFGVYLWLLAAVAAATFCLLPPYDA